MKRMNITDRELIAVLRRMVPETGSLLCLGCGHERSCSTHGCAVLREAVERLKELTAQAGPLNDPLTLEELRGMDGEPVWVVEIGVRAYWALVVHVSETGVNLCAAGDSDDYGGFDLYGGTWLAYRRKPEEGTV